jgi:Tfp pilus assembly protein PilN
MVQVNLLPRQAKEAKKTKLPSVELKPGPFLFILIGVASLALLLWLILGFQVIGRQRRLAKVNTQWQKLGEQIRDLQRLESEKNTLEIRRAFLQAFFAKRVLFAKKLFELNRLIPTGIWLSELRMEQKREKAKDGLLEKLNLNMRGQATSIGGVDMVDLIGGFMSKLKQDKEFFQDFTYIELGPLKRNKIGECDIMDFEISLSVR